METNIPEKLKPDEYESKWQEKWQKEGIYSPDFKTAKNPYYNLMMFPYPSAEGLHIGNVYAFTGVDIHGRFMRMKGYDVFEPIGLDGFGIHSENFAIKVGRHPKEQAKISAKNFYRQLQAIGNSFDWKRRLETYDPDYYRWTQWIFVEMFKHGLAYRAKAAVNYCPSCKTVLADEQVIKQVISDKRKVISKENKKLSQVAQVSKAVEEVSAQVCERCGTEVEIKELEQWFFRITAYAERLLQNTYKQQFNWSEKVKVGQRNWIGKKEGININYPIIQLSNNPINTNKEIVTVFTTRPDTNFGATFIVLAPEHPLALKITSKENLENVKKYIESTKKKSKEDRIREGKKKTGVFTGAYAINQLNNYQMPIWISDFALMEFGTGAIVGVPGHDVRDFEFAKEFNLPIVRVVVGYDNDRSNITQIEQVQEEEGKMINSGFLNGMDIHKATAEIMDYFEEKGWGKRVTTYHLRDWLISRQRYWGAPIPMIYCEACKRKGLSWFSSSSGHPKPPNGGEGSLANASSNKLRDSSPVKPVQNDKSWAAGWFPVPFDELPVLLPDVQDWRPTGTGRGPLAGHPEFYQTKCPNCGSDAKRETDVCDTFLDSSWYYLRYPFVSKHESMTDENLCGSQFAQVKTHNDDEKSSSFAQVRPTQILSDHTLKNKTQISSATASKDEAPWDNEIMQRWMPVDSYIGGAEHTVLHLLYTRFIWQALRDWGYLEVANPKKGEFDPDEPFKRFFAHGLIIKDGAKMSKSKGNVVVPDEYIKLYGADTLRTYLMFLGPFDSGGDFRDTGITGMYKWLSRVWRLANNKIEDLRLKNEDKEADKFFAKIIKGVTQDLEKLRYNTAIAKMMEFTNWWMEHEESVNIEMVKDFIKLLAPFAPYMTEELYSRLSVLGSQSSDSSSSVIGLSDNATGNQITDRPETDNRKQKTDNWSIHFQPWPKYDPKLIIEDMAKMVVQINGKTRDIVEMTIQKANQQASVEQLTKNSAKVKKWLDGAKIAQVIFIPGKLINYVVRS